MSATAKITAYQSIAQRVVEQYVQHVTPMARGSEFMDILLKNNERLQGSLVLLGYEMCGGKDSKMIERAALAIEIFHAYIQCVEKGTDVTQALRAQHEAEIILANVEAAADSRLKAVSITNRTLMLANLAQFDTASAEDTVAWKATELTLNPIHVGQVLAGSDCDANNAVTPLATEVGKQLACDKPIDVQSFFDELCKITW